MSDNGDRTHSVKLTAGEVRVLHLLETELRDENRRVDAQRIRYQREAEALQQVEEAEKRANARCHAALEEVLTKREIPGEKARAGEWRYREDGDDVYIEMTEHDTEHDENGDAPDDDEPDNG